MKISKVVYSIEKITYYTYVKEYGLISFKNIS